MTNPETDAYELFMRLLLEQESALKAYVRRLVPTWHDVEEVAQQAGLVAWKKFDELEDTARFGGWLMTIARFEALKYRRSLARSPLVFSDALVEKLAEADEPPLQGGAERRQALESCLRSLEATDRELILSVHRPGVTVRDYAKTSPRSEQAIYKAVQRLRVSLLGCVKRRLAAEAYS